MGADAEVFVFDYERYSTEVVPSIRRLLLDGMDSVILSPSMRPRGIAMGDMRGDDGYIANIVFSQD